jgi:outer membrane protein assembly factor BamB
VSSTPAIGTDGTLYVGGLGRAGGREAAFHAIDPEGNELWKYQPEGSGNAFYGSPVIDANGDIYVACGSRFISLDENGALRWEFTTSRRRNIVATPAIGADGTLYLAADEFYALAD